MILLNTAAILVAISPGENGSHLSDDTFRCIFLNEKFCILIYNFSEVLFLSVQ